ncbi:hypothetical protein [Streptomyces sp. NPDC101455]|uniref:hypothetical protein n=1 Tax=Streptomyces sp. NPDC101455 TaxID=3366142 RepID=UPI003812D9E2
MHQGQPRRARSTNTLDAHTVDGDHDVCDSREQLCHALLLDSRRVWGNRPMKDWDVMTNPRNRENDRAVRAYRREHPGTTIEQAREAVAARARRQPGLPPRIPAAPLPRPSERLEGYVQRVAATIGVRQHRAMELLGLEPGTSATERLDHLADGLPDHTVRALVAATGMTADQARALTAPSAAIGTAAAAAIEALDALDAVRLTSEEVLDSKMIRPGGDGKTRFSTTLYAEWDLRNPGVLFNDTGSRPGDGKTITDAPALARLLAQASGQRPLLIDTDPPATSHQTLAPLLLGDTSSPFIGQPLLAQYPADPDLVDEILKELGVTPSPGTE